MTGKRVLLVDDEISSIEVLGMLMAEEGWHVTLAGDGLQALERLAEAAPDLLVSDFMMPRMHGVELLRTLREMPAWRHLPVLLMSGAPESALAPHAPDYQAFLRKPFTLEDFLEAVRRLHALSSKKHPAP